MLLTTPDGDHVYRALQEAPATRDEIRKNLGWDDGRVDAALRSLGVARLVRAEGRTYRPLR